MGVILQLLAGGFYLLNKIFLSLSERQQTSNNPTRARKLRIAAWVVYLLGLPPWVVIFAQEHNWIAAALEISSVPAMVLGLLIAVRGTTSNPPRWLDQLALILIPAGLALSLYDFGGLNTLRQCLEIALSSSFLIGTYLLAKEKRSGYLWYIVMHVFCGYLMLIQGYFWLFLQQLVSLVFIIDAYRSTRKTNK